MIKIKKTLKSFTCFFCSYTANNYEQRKEHEFFYHIIEVFFPSSPGIIPEYLIYPYREPTPEEKQIIPCVIKECHSIITGKNLTRHVMNRHCHDIPPFQCKSCFKFYDNHVSVLQHAIECNLGAIDKFFHENELKLLKLCVNNKKAFNIYKECFDTYLNHDIKYDPSEYDYESNKSISFLENSVKLSLKLIQRILNAFFKDKVLQRHQLEKTFSVTDRNNFDEMYNFFHSIASLFPEIFNSLIPIIECCENCYSNPSFCNCNKIFINNLPINNNNNYFLNIQVDIPPFIQAPDGIYHYALNPNTFFVNGTHKLFKIIDGITLDSDGVYGALLSSAIYADIFDFMKMDNENLNKHLIDIGYDNYNERYKLITAIRNKCFFLMNNRNPERDDKIILLDDTVFLPTSIFTNDNRAEFLKNWRDEINNYCHNDNYDNNQIKFYTSILPSLDYTNYNNNFRNQKEKSSTVTSRLAISLKKVFSIYTSASDEIVEECLKKVDLTHIYYCITNKQENNNYSINNYYIDDYYINNYEYESSNNDNDIYFEVNNLTHQVQKIKLDFFETIDNNEGNLKFNNQEMEFSYNDFDEYEILDKLMDTLPNNGLLMDTPEKNIYDNNDNYNISYISENDTSKNIQNYTFDLCNKNNNLTNAETYTTEMDYEINENLLNNSNNTIITQNQPIDLSMNNINSNVDITNQPFDLSLNLSNQLLITQSKNNHILETNVNSQSSNCVYNHFLNQVNILNDNVNLYPNTAINTDNTHNIFFQNIFSVHENITKNLSNSIKKSRNYGILNKSIQKKNHKK
uniref:C2H2-type domain-containing protein n=1 Tax=Strongyloides stercoralis TaxID=6248 RepID=A0AAF5HZH9_STRER